MSFSDKMVNSSSKRECHSFQRLFWSF